MGIVSLSIPQEQLVDIDGAVKSTGQPGRSALVREALVQYLDNLLDETELSGEVDALIIINHDHDDKNFHVLRHRHQALIRAHLHQDANKRCHELLLVRGHAAKIRDLMHDARQRTFTTRLHALI